MTREIDIELPLFGPYYLSAYREEDIPTVMASMGNKEITKTLAGPPFDPYTIEHAKAFVDKARTYRLKPGVPKYYVVRDRDNGDIMAGTIDIRPSNAVPDGISKIPPEAETVEAGFGFYLLPAYWGKGIMPKALHALIWEVGVKELGIKKFTGDCFAGNWGSRKTFEKNGFRLVREEKDCFFKATTNETFSEWFMELELP